MRIIGVPRQVFIVLLVHSAWRIVRALLVAQVRRVLRAPERAVDVDPVRAARDSVVKAARIHDILSGDDAQAHHLPALAQTDMRRRLDQVGVLQPRNVRPPPVHELPGVAAKLDLTARKVLDITRVSGEAGGVGHVLARDLPGDHPAPTRVVGVDLTGVHRLPRALHDLLAKLAGRESLLVHSTDAEHAAHRLHRAVELPPLRVARTREPDEVGVSRGVHEDLPGDRLAARLALQHERREHPVLDNGVHGPGVEAQVDAAAEHEGVGDELEGLRVKRDPAALDGFVVVGRAAERVHLAA